MVTDAGARAQTDVTAPGKGNRDAQERTGVFEGQSGAGRLVTLLNRRDNSISSETFSGARGIGHNRYRYAVEGQDDCASAPTAAPTDKVAESTPTMLNEVIPDRQAWRRQSIAPKDWLVSLPQRCIDELDAAVYRVRRDPLPTLLLDPQQFSLAACAQVMDHVRDQLRTGMGLAVLDRVPVERYTTEENTAIAWLLGSLLGRLVAQKWDGTMVYDVRDTGQALDYGVRRSVTNLDLTFHTDAP